MGSAQFCDEVEILYLWLDWFRDTCEEPNGFSTLNCWSRDH